MEALIENAYKKTNYGSYEKVFKCLQKEGHIEISRRQIKEYLEKQEQEQ